MPFSVTSESIAWTPLTWHKGKAALCSSLSASSQRYPSRSHFLLREAIWGREGPAWRMPSPYSCLKDGSWCPSAGGIDPLVRGLLAKKAKLVHQDKMMTGELRNMLFQPNHTIHGFDLAAINIQRSRDHGQPGEWVWTLTWSGELLATFWGSWTLSSGTPRSQSLLKLEACLFHKHKTSRKRSLLFS